MPNNEQDGEDLHIRRLLETLDHPLPEFSLAEIQRVAGGKQEKQAKQWSLIRRVAVVALLLGAAGAVYAIPGSPFRSWISAVRTPDASVVNQPQATGTAGMAVPPGERFVITFAAHQPQGEARVALVSKEEVAVRTTDATVSFTLEEQGVIIGNANSRASFDIEIPQSATFVEVRVAHRTMFVKDRSQVTGPLTISLSAPR